MVLDVLDKRERSKEVFARSRSCAGLLQVESARKWAFRDCGYIAILLRWRMSVDVEGGGYFGVSKTALRSLDEVSFTPAKELLECGVARET